MSQQRNEIVLLKRDCPALLVPDGQDVMLPKGSFSTIVQSLGGSYTIVVGGNMMRIDGANADALGFEPEVIEYEPTEDDTVPESDLWKALGTIYDPEIPVSIVELGLIYSCEPKALMNGGNRVNVSMTLTAPGCGMGPVLVEEAKLRLLNVPNVTEVDVALVFDPPWSREMMSEVALLELGIF